MTLANGSKLGPYEIVGAIGAGGMGEVYRARDTRLGRDVAIKILPQHLSAKANVKQRFEREARAISSLQHPNICTLYDVGHQDGIDFLVMEYLEGESLAKRLEKGALATAELLRIAIEIADALEKAHRQGVVHRDLKPGNIMLTKSGAKLLDFGLAKAAAPPTMTNLSSSLTASHEIHDSQEAQLTARDTIVGTFQYMAPEQVRGESVDARADIFSFGCVLYEMATGERAFARSTAVETLAAILHDTPIAPSRRRSELPMALDRVVAHSLEKDAAARFQSAHDLQFALAALAPGPEPAALERGAASVAVLPFVNFGADPENEFFADGVTEDVIAHLAKIRSLKVISRTSVMAYKKRECSLREISERLGTTTVLEGSVRRAGNRVRIVAQLIDGATDKHIWADTYDRDLTDIFAIQTDVALKIASALRAELTNDERTRVCRRPTPDLEAYEFYLRGRDSFNRFTEEGYRRCLLEFEAAVARDPKFALAWASIAEVHAEMVLQGCTESDRPPEETIRRAKAAAARALETDDELAEAHGITGLIRFIFDFDWPGGEREFLRAIELSPNSAEAHEHYSWLCASLERYDDAIREVRRARELDPILIQSDVATTLLRAGRVEEALREARRSVQDEPGSPRCHSNLGWALIFQGEKAAGIASLERSVALAPGATLFLAQLGQACALTGDMERARQILEQLRDRATREFVSPYHFAYIYAGLGETGAAIECLERAFERRSGGIYGIKGSFLFRNLRSEPRFQSLLRRMNLD